MLALTLQVQSDPGLHVFLTDILLQSAVSS